MKKYTIALWGFMFAALLQTLAGMRDIFAPGFLMMSGRKMGSGDIALEFALAAMFFVVGLSFTQRSLNKQRAKKNHS